MGGGCKNPEKNALFMDSDDISIIHNPCGYVLFTFARLKVKGSKSRVRYESPGEDLPGHRQVRVK